MKFKRIQTFDSRKNRIWCLDLAYVDKLAINNNGVKYVLPRQDLFDRTVEARGMETQESNERVCAIRTLVREKNRSEKILVDRAIELAGECKELRKSGEVQNYSAMIETKAALAKSTT